MKQKLAIVFSSLWLAIASAFGQDSTTVAELQQLVEQARIVTIAHGRPATMSLGLDLGTSAVRNTYLVPLLYEGVNVGINFDRWRKMRHGKWNNQQIINVKFAFGDAESGRNSTMWSGRATYRYAMHRQLATYLEKAGMRLYLGPYAGAEIGYDYSLKTAGGNNPATMRLVGNVGASAVANFDYRLFGKRCTFDLQLQMPLMGAGFMPEYGASYYETFLLDNTKHNAHFTSLHNQQDLDVRAATNIPFSVLPCFGRSGSMLRLGVYYHIETMDINHIVERYSSIGLCIGWTWRYLPIK